MKDSKTPIQWIIGLFVVLVIVGGLLKVRPLKPSRKIAEPVLNEPSSPKPLVTSEPQLASPSVRPRLSSSKMDQSWERFEQKFGTNLKPKYDSSGRLISIQRDPSRGEGLRVDQKFNLKDPNTAIARAREIVEFGSKLLGIRDTWPIGNPVVRTSPFSAQVYFTETYEGLDIAPVGTVKIDLGSKGELVSLYSSYTPDIEIRNQFKLDFEKAREIAQSSVPGAEFKSTPLDGGGKVLWVKGSVGTYAYQFVIRGHEIVIDGETGTVLFQRDRRKH